ncbi:hypothetical protein A6R68_15625, partial [Neotoma lepida]
KLHIPVLAAEAESPWAEGAFTELPLYAGRTKPEVPTMSPESEQPDDTGGPASPVTMSYCTSPHFTLALIDPRSQRLSGLVDHDMANGEKEVSRISCIWSLAFGSCHSCELSCVGAADDTCAVVTLQIHPEFSFED